MYIWSAKPYPSFLIERAHLHTAVSTSVFFAYCCSDLGAVIRLVEQVGIDPGPNRRLIHFPPWRDNRVGHWDMPYYIEDSLPKTYVCYVIWVDFVAPSMRENLPEMCL